MKIIIAGAGEVGFHLAKLLSFESQDITLIDTDRKSLAYADAHLDIKVVKGDAASLVVLKDARVDKTDLVIGVTSSETTNITVCVLAKQLGAKRTIARISNTEFIENKDEAGFTQFGIDELISPESLAANEILLLLNKSGFDETFEFENGALTMIGLTLPRNSAFVDRSAREIGEQYTDLDYMPIAIQRHKTNDTVIPRGNTIFKEGDQAYFITTDKGVDRIFQLSGKVKEAIKNVMILGGSKIGYESAKNMCRENYKVKLIEGNKEKAFEIADDIPGCLVINGDGRNVELLEEEAIENMDAFIAVTGNSETNIISCLVAKAKGVSRTIALVENIDYLQVSQSIGINTFINKKLIAANAIFRHIRKGEIVAMTNISNLNAELMEFLVTDSSKVCNKLVREVDFPRGAVIGGAIRNGKGIVTLGDFRIQDGDRIVVCCLPDSVKRVEKLFV